MSIDEIETAALPKARAWVANRLLDSLDELSPDENTRLDRLRPAGRKDRRLTVRCS